MRIAYFQDLCPVTQLGGAQANDWGLIQKGIQRNHKISIITPQNVGLKSLEGVDLVIFSNCVNFDKNVIKEVCDKFPYVFAHKDFIFYQWRLFYPVDENLMDCYGRDFWLSIFEKAKLHIWLSPLHREAFLVAYPELKKFPKTVIPSCIDVDLWKQVEGVERRKNTVIGINCLELFKGRYNIHDYVADHQELQFTFIGGSAGINQPNCSYLPYVKNEELPKLLSQFEYFVHLPDHTECFGRVNVEALLSGCKIITNENNGAFSYDWIKKGDVKEIREKMRVVGVAFWEEIEKLKSVIGYEESWLKEEK